MDLNQIRFGPGTHKPTATPTGDRDMCIMEAVAFMAGELWSDAPTCASPVVASFLRVWNDALFDKDRDRLLPAEKWIPRLIGSRGDNAVEERRSYIVLDWMVRTNVPAWMDIIPALSKYAAELRALPEIVDSATARSSKPTLLSARKAAQEIVEMTLDRDPLPEDHLRALEFSATEAARFSVTSPEAGSIEFSGATVAREATGAAAWDVALEASEAAAVIAGRKLRPTVKKLQQSALDLIDRILACGHPAAHPTSGSNENHSPDKNH